MRDLQGRVRRLEMRRCPPPNDDISPVAALVRAIQGLHSSAGSSCARPTRRPAVGPGRADVYETASRLLDLLAESRALPPGEVTR